MEEITNNKNTMDKQPLVSIIVITYNSSKYVLETLESAKAQTYQNIELIVSDDCSTDNTVEICKEWIEKNKERFVRTELITAEKNTGIPANCNRGVKAAQGEWVKLIAGDDILDSHCIESFIAFCKTDDKIKIVESISQFFNEKFSYKNFTNVQNFGNHIFFHKNSKAEDQYQILLRRNLIHSPSVFLNLNIIKEVGWFDESNKYIEDHPLWLKLTKKGYKIFFLNKITVYYRNHNNSIFSSIPDQKLFNSFYIKRRDMDKKYIYPNITQIERILKDIEFFRKKTIEMLGLNKNTFICKVICYGSYKISPYYIFINLKIHKLANQIKNR